MSRVKLHDLEFELQVVQFDAAHAGGAGAFRGWKARR